MCRGSMHGGTIHAMTRMVLVDGNNVMDSRPDGWWRNRAEAAERLVAGIAPAARCLGGAWTIVFDGPVSRRIASRHEFLCSWLSAAPGLSMGNRQVCKGETGRRPGTRTEQAG